MMKKQKINKFFQKKINITILSSLLVSFILVILLYNNFFMGWNTSIVDNFYGGKNPLQNIVIVEIDDKSLQEIGRWPWDRKIIAQGLEKIKGAKVIGIDIAFFENSTNESDDALATAIKKKGNVVLAAEYTSFEVNNKKIVMKNLLVPIEKLRKATKGVGYINIITDMDGVTRSLYIDKNSTVKSFAEEIISVYLRKDFRSDKEGRVLINFIGPAYSFQYISFSDLIKNEFDGNFFKDKIVLIGATSPDLHDNYLVPTSKKVAMPGVEVHANIIQTLIQKNFLQEQDFFSTMIIIILFSLLSGLLILNFKVVRSLIIIVLAIIMYIVICDFMFRKGIIMNVIYPIFALVLNSIVVTSSLYLLEESKKKEIINLFGKYLSRNVVEHMIKEDEIIELKGVEREITIMFVDIRGFTSLSEKLKPRELVSLLNKYLRALTKVVFKYEGTLDKYMGDAIMAFFNAPLDVESHSYKACLTALEMQKEVEVLNKKLGRDLRIGIGINTGKAVVGNIGGEERVEYTAIGDSVNLAARLEGLNKIYNTNIIVSEYTYNKVKDKNLYFRELDFVKVKGKDKPVRIYELRLEKYKHIDLWNEALSLYRKGKFSEAQKLFEKLAKKGDKTSRVFVERCKELKKMDLENWNGIYEIKIK